MRKKTLMFAVKAALTAALIGWLVSRIDVSATWQRVAGVSGGMLLAATGLLLAQGVLGAVRWMVVQRALGPTLPFRRVLAIYFTGLFFNQVLPSSVGGDPVRMYLTHRGGLPLARAVNGVMLERVATVAALVFMVALLQPLILDRIGGGLKAWVFPLLSLTAVGGIGVVCLLDRLPERLGKWRAVRALAYLATDTRRVFLSPPRALAVLGIAAVGHANLSMAVWVMAQGMDVGLTVTDCLVLVPPVILATTLPISIAGWGVREGAMVAALSTVGVAPEASVALSVLLGLLAIVTSLPGGLVWVLGGGVKPAEVEAAMTGDDP
ncbi:MAG: flippase-like domain-containing protein [Rhodobacterales bacterium]|nr:flippase-like domain-containing protein [Rhodobacterales bacterium]